MWIVLTPERLQKTGWILKPLQLGWPGSRLVAGEPPDTINPFIVWGQIWVAETMIRKALNQDKRRFYQIDNGFYKPARGSVNGYYRFMYSRPHPVFVEDEALRRERGSLGAPMVPWRKTGKHIVLACPGPDFGKAFGLTCLNWHQPIYEKLKKATDRPIVVRPAPNFIGGNAVPTRPLAVDLKNAWAVVTHSSNVAVDAVRAGIPVFVEETASARPVGNPISTLTLDIEQPSMPDRSDWWASLMCQQFTIDEMRRGLAYRYLTIVAKQVEERKSYWWQYGLSDNMKAARISKGGSNG